jgi:hypothetical protein
MGGMPGAAGGEEGSGGRQGSSQGAGGSADAGAAQQGESGGGEGGDLAGAGQTTVRNTSPGGDVEESARDGAKVARIPDDIPADTSGEDQVAKQLREAAQAETDPEIREALWDEYRKQMGLKKN